MASEDKIRVLVIDDDASLLAVLEAGLSAQPGYAVTACAHAAEARARLERETFDLVVTDYSLGDPELNGLGILRQAQRCPLPPLVIIITAFASLEITLDAIHLGAYDFLTKPFQLDELHLVVRNAARTVQLNRENSQLHRQMAELIQLLDGLEQRQEEWLDHIRQMTQDDAHASGDEIMPLDIGRIHEIRRRRMRDQLSAYLRQGEGLAHDLSGERERIRDLLHAGARASAETAGHTDYKV
jgi:DNA-binding NtrC family response regulator